MITILPVKDLQKAAKIQAQNGITEPCTILAMQDGEDILGFAAVDLQNGILQIVKLFAEGYDFSAKPNMEQHFVLDSLVRSAASYGETFGATQIQTSFPDFFDFMKSRGFSVENNCCVTPIDTIVKYK